MVEGHHSGGLTFEEAKELCRSAEGARADLASISNLEESGQFNVVILESGSMISTSSIVFISKISKIQRQLFKNLKIIAEDTDLDSTNSINFIHFDWNEIISALLLDLSPICCRQIQNTCYFKLHYFFQSMQISLGPLGCACLCYKCPLYP